MNCIPFNELLLNEKPLTECEMVGEYDGNRYRLYLDRLSDKSGFEAKIIEFDNCDVESESIWDCPKLYVNQLFRIRAAFDGVRYIDLEGGTNGINDTVFCPNINALIEILNKITELEKECCWDYQ